LGSVQDQLVEIQQLLASGQADVAHTRITALSVSVSKDLKDDPDIDGIDNPADRDQPEDDK
jgi:hypothetical protein